MKDAAHILAQRYARAFYNLYRDQLGQKEIDQFNKVIDHIASSKASLVLFTLPHCTVATKKEMMSSLLQLMDDTSHLLEPLLNLLIAHQRSILVGQVLRALVACYYKDHKIECFNITASHSINENELQVLRSFLEKETGKTVKISYNTDQSLIAGIRMQSDVHVWEYSVRRKLQELQGAHIG